MGACISCFKGGADDSGEETSLLKGQQHMYGNDVEESVLLKQQQRQQELNTIVNDLTDSLIDVSLFLNTNTGETIISSPLIKPDTETSLEDSTTISRTASTTFPVFITNEEKVRLTRKVSELNDDVKQKCLVESKDKLYLKF